MDPIDYKNILHDKIWVQWWWNVFNVTTDWIESKHKPATVRSQEPMFGGVIDWGQTYYFNSPEWRE